MRPNAGIASTKLTHFGPADLIAAPYRPIKAQPPDGGKTQRRLAQKKSRPKAALNSTLMIVYQTTINAGFDF